MFLTIAFLLALTGVLVASRVLAPTAGNPDPGWMSQQWLAEHRATRPL
jgi:hypothetical protein